MVAPGGWGASDGDDDDNYTMKDYFMDQLNPPKPNEAETGPGPKKKGPKKPPKKPRKAMPPGPARDRKKEKEMKVHLNGGDHDQKNLNEKINKTGDGTHASKGGKGQSNSNGKGGKTDKKSVDKAVKSKGNMDTNNKDLQAQKDNEFDLAVAGIALAAIVLFFYFKS